MEIAGDELLSRPALPGHQHRAWHLGDPRDQLLEPHDRRAAADQRALALEAALERRHFSPEPAAIDGALDLVDHPLHRLRLVDEAGRAESHRLDASVEVAGAGVHDDRYFRALPL